MELRLLEVEAAPATDPPSLARLCGHVRLDARVPALGYRYFAVAGGDRPGFFCKRIRTDAGIAAVTLVAGADPATGETAIGACTTAGEALTAIATGTREVWAFRLTRGATTIPIPELAGRWAHQDPVGSVKVARELALLEPLAPSTCPLCRQEA